MRAVETRIGAKVRDAVGSSGIPAASGRGANGSANRLGGLDLLRLLAALAVVLFHFGYAGPTRGTMATAIPDLAAFTKYGFLGVDLFFLISGFVISASATGRSPVDFAISRFARLYPAYVVAMTSTATALVVAAPGTTDLGILAVRWLANLTMVAPAFGQPFMDGAYWSIVLEIVFYGWVAVLIATGLFQRHLTAAIAVWLVIAFANEAVIGSKALRLAFLTDYAGLFAAGMLIYRIWIGDRGAACIGLLAAAFAHGLLHATANQVAFAHFYGDTLDRTTLWLAHAGVYALFLGALALSSRLPPTPAILALGGITYPLYLLHQQIGYLAIDGVAPIIGTGAAVVFVVVLMIAASHLIARYVEPAGRAGIAWLTLTLRSSAPSISSRILRSRDLSAPYSNP